MAKITIKNATTRVIKWKNRILADFAPDQPIDDVLRMHAQSPGQAELAGATLEGPTIDGDTATYTVTTRVGTKG